MLSLIKRLIFMPDGKTPRHLPYGTCGGSMKKCSVGDKPTGKPINEMDRLFQRHDNGYYAANIRGKTRKERKAGRIEADKVLVKELQNISAKGYLELGAYGHLYRKAAIAIFSAKIAWHTLTTFCKV